MLQLFPLNMVVSCWYVVRTAKHVVLIKFAQYRFVIDACVVAHFGEPGHAIEIISVCQSFNVF